VSPPCFAAAALQAHRQLPADAESIAALYSRYEDEKRRRRLVDFDDLLVRYADALDTDSRFAAAQRWKWRHLFVDELQDVNPLQCRLLLALLGDNDDLFVVGDPNQAIYGWNGADPGFLADFPARWPKAEVVRLDDNHRSSPQVVAVASAALGRQGGVTLKSSQPDGPRPELRSYPSEDAEAMGVAVELREAHRCGVDWKDMAVLARTNSQLEVVGQALVKAGVPYRPVAQSPDVDVSDHPQDPAVDDERVTLSSFHRAKGLQWPSVWVCGLESGLVPIGYATSAPALAEERRLLYVAITRAQRQLYCSWARTRRTSGGTALHREPSPWLMALAPHCSGSDDNAGSDDRSGAGKRPGDGRPRVSGSSDAVRGPGPGLTDFLVSARNRLSSSRTVRGTHHRRRWDLPGEGDALDGEPLNGEQTRDDHRDPDIARRDVAARLCEWRRRLARASGVPAHVLLHDSTVDVIAKRRPASTEELLTVPGLGPVKVARYGPAILEVVRASALAEAGSRAPN
jgi:DNA helicase-2/ATP-dependent DNA helicase PcrA